MKNKVYFIVFAAVLLLTAVPASSQVIQGTYAVKNVATGMLLRIKDAKKSDGTPLVAYSPVNWKCVTWDFTHVKGHTYQLRNLFTDKTFQSQKPAPAEGVALEQQPFISEQANQQYEFIPVEKNIYLIRLQGTDLYITPSDDKGTVNGAIILAKKTGSKLQEWVIYEQYPEM